MQVDSAAYELLPLPSPATATSELLDYIPSSCGRLRERPMAAYRETYRAPKEMKTTDHIISPYSILLYIYIISYCVILLFLLYSSRPSELSSAPSLSPTASQKASAPYPSGLQSRVAQHELLEVRVLRKAFEELREDPQRLIKGS